MLKNIKSLFLCHFACKFVTPFYEKKKRDFRLMKSVNMSYVVVIGTYFAKHVLITNSQL